MALQCNVTILGDISVSNAYVRIGTVTGFKNYDTGAYQMVIGVCVFKNAAEAAKTSPTKLPAPNYDRFKTTYSLVSTANAVTQAYSYLKTLPQFTGATDI